MSETPVKKRTKSVIWQFFTISECRKKASCNYCGTIMNFTLSSFSNLGRHLRNKHPGISLETMKKNSIGEVPVEIYSVQEVEEVGTTENLKTYEITMKGFDEMEQEDGKSEQEDPTWNPDNTEDWKIVPVPKILSVAGSSSPSKIKKTPRRSALWNHFQRSSCKTSGMCLHCGKTIKLGTISNLSRHLRNKHPTIPLACQKHEESIETKSETFTSEEYVPINDIDICTEVIEVSVDNMQHPENIVETKTDECRNSIVRYTFNEMSSVNVTQSSQTEFLEDYEDFDISDYIRPKKAAVLAEQLDRQLVKMLVKGCHPMSTVEQPAFKDFINILNPKYELPSESKMSKEIIPECYRECEKKACKSLQAAEAVCLYVDQWKSKTSNYLCITAHFINAECKFESLFLSCHVLSIAENATDISERLLETVTDWEIVGKVVGVVTDNTSAIATAVTLCNWLHVPHFIRVLCVIVHESLQVIKSLLFKVRQVIDELTKAPETLAEIYSKQRTLKLPPAKLITKVKSDWSSSFTMLEMLSRFVTLKTPISDVTPHQGWLKLTEHEWKVLASVVDVLDFFKVVKMEVMASERVCLSKIIFYIRALKRRMKTLKTSSTMPSDATYVATIAESSLTNQFKDLEEVDLVTNVVLLDPRLKKYVFEDESEFAAACSNLKKEVCELVLPEVEYPEPNSNTLWHSFDTEVKKLNAVKDPIGKGILELENYLQEPVLGREEDPLVWWNHRSAIYPRLFKLAKKYLCVTTKSAAKVSISFKSAYMLSQLKNSESSTSESEVMFLHHNM